MRRRKPGRPKGSRNGKRRADYPRKLVVSNRHADWIAEECRKYGVTQRVFVETMIDSYAVAPDMHRMLAEMVASVYRWMKETRMENLNGRELSATEMA